MDQRRGRLFLLSMAFTGSLGRKTYWRGTVQDWPSTLKEWRAT